MEKQLCTDGFDKAVSDPESLISVWKREGGTCPS